MRFDGRIKEGYAWALGGALILLGIALFAFWTLPSHDLVIVFTGDKVELQGGSSSLMSEVLEPMHRAQLHLIVPVALGLWVWRQAYKQMRTTAAATAALAQEELDLGLPRPVGERKRPITVAPEPPPRIGDDPFRDPPGPRPIVVERFVKPAPAAPIVPGDPNDKPTQLT